MEVDLLLQFVRNIIRFVGAGVGIILVVMLAWNGFRYLTAGPNSNQVAEAKDGFRNVILAFILFAFGFALLNWLSPGGVTGL